MAQTDDFELPVHGQEDGGGSATAPSCSAVGYVSNEEAAVVAAMKRLRERALAVRDELRAAAPADRDRLAATLEELRGRWRELAARREAAYRRKMIMLGHLRE